MNDPMVKTEHMSLQKKTFKTLSQAVLCIFSALITVLLLIGIVFCSWSLSGVGSKAGTNYDIINRFDGFITNTISSAVEGFVEIEKVYLLSDNDQVAPAPDPESFGQTDDPASLQWLINKSHPFMDGQELLFSTDTPILDGSSVRYYMDETLLVLTWKQPINNVVYTISEVKIAHPTQFRRFLSDGEFGSNRQYLTSQMASSVNAVVASAGDFYKYRSLGMVVVNGEVKRFNGTILDTCFIDDQGNLIFSPAGELTDWESAQNFVDDNHIRFSLCFGPILVDDGKYVDPGYYPLGEIYMDYSRAALCQMGELHYLLVTANGEAGYRVYPTIPSFGMVLQELGCEKAYALDGGQTATIVMDSKVINEVSYGAERYISDIIYFATAIPKDD